MVHFTSSYVLVAVINWGWLLRGFAESYLDKYEQNIQPLETFIFLKDKGHPQIKNKSEVRKQVGKT